MKRRFAVGTDIGGTFTDMVVIDEAGSVRLFKVPTTPHDRSDAIVGALKIAADEYHLSLQEFCSSIDYFAHGTTAATNAYIERNGVRTGLLTTRGFGDTLLIQRSMGSWTGIGDASGHYSARRRPTSLIDPEDIIEINERVDSSGEVIVDLQEGEVRDAARRLRIAGVEAVAVCFLFAFVNGDHERRARRILQEEMPTAFLTISSEIAPVSGEYERTATAVVNAYVGPVVSRYVKTLEAKLHDCGFAGKLTVMDSAGGVVDAAEATQRAIELLASGPAGGVLASAALSKRLGVQNVITADMGGTSFDVAVVVDGEPLVKTSSIVGGYHLASPRIQVTAIGAGGGSIAWIDEWGILKVGPQSAGAVPGPACYANGGSAPTVTDADVVLGIIDPAYFLGGRIRLDRQRAEDAIERHIAGPLGMTTEAAAAGIRAVAENQMADLVRAVTIGAGFDPRDFTIMAYGGAGPTHAHAIAEEAGIGCVIVPYTATVHSAYGAVSSDRFRAFQRSDRLRTPPGAPDPATHFDAGRIEENFQALEQQCRKSFADHPGLDLKRFLHLRFRRQIHELAVTVPRKLLDLADLRACLAEFLNKYERIHGAGTSLPEAGFEIETFRIEGRVRAPSGGTIAAAVPDAGRTLQNAYRGKRSVLFGTNSYGTAVYRGEEIPFLEQLSGPAILEFFGTTVVVGPNYDALLDDTGNVVLQSRVAANRSEQLAETRA